MCVLCRKEYVKNYKIKNKKKIQKSSQELYLRKRDSIILAYKNKPKVSRKPKSGLAYKCKTCSLDKISNEMLSASMCKLCKSDYDKVLYKKKRKVILKKNRKERALLKSSPGTFKCNKCLNIYSSKDMHTKTRCLLCKRVCKNLSHNKKIKTDIYYKIKCTVSASILQFLSKSGNTKGGKTFKHLPYTVQDLKDHIESNFEPWMSWGNWGLYRVDAWNDKDQSTWTWQIDHIIPHSSFNYTSLKDPLFVKCWALDNLRPLSSKENLLKSNKKV